MCSDRPKALMIHRLGSLQSSRLPHLAPLEPNRRALQSLVNSRIWNRVKRIHPFVLHEAVNTAWKMKSGTQTHLCAASPIATLPLSTQSAMKFTFFSSFLSERMLKNNTPCDCSDFHSLSRRKSIRHLPLCCVPYTRTEKKRCCCLMTLTFDHSLFIPIQKFEPSACSFCL